MPDEIGYQTSGVLTWGQLAAESNETNPDLMWPENLAVYDKMRREDSQVGSVLRAVFMPLRSAGWMIDPAGAAPEVVELIANDLGLPVKGQEPKPQLRTKDKFSWDEHLRLALLELVHGHSFFEQVYRFDNVTKRRHLRKLAWRPPRSISKINIARDGGLVSIEQHAGTEPIPVNRLVAYVNEREGADWVGQSLLRQAYKNWLLKDRMLRAQALTVERNGLGVPVYTGAPVPENATQEERDAWIKSERESGLNIATKFRAGEAAGASLTPESKLELMGVTGKLPDTDGPIRYHDEQIARAGLAHFLTLGGDKSTGSYALSDTFEDFFTGSLNAVGMHVRSVTQQHVIEDLVDENWGPTTPAPQLVFETLGSEFPPTAEAMAALVNAGIITPDANLEAFMRARFGVPIKADGTNAPPPPAPDIPPTDPEETP